MKLARSLPTIDKADPRIAALDGTSALPAPSHGNFFKRFAEMRAVAHGHACGVDVIYVRMVKERFGLDLIDFHNKRTMLCDAICAAVDAKQPYDELVIAYAELIRMERAGELPNGTADSLNAAVDHPLGIVAIGLQFLDRINLLLEQAYSAFEAITLNAPFLEKLLFHGAGSRRRDWVGPRLVP